MRRARLHGAALQWTGCHNEQARVLAGAAAPLKTRAGVGRHSAEVTVDDAVYHLDAGQAPGGGRMITATPAPEGGGSDAAFGRFVNIDGGNLCAP